MKMAGRRMGNSFSLLLFVCFFWKWKPEYAGLETDLVYASVGKQ